MRISSERDDAVNEAQRAASQLQGERDQLLRNVEYLERERDDLRGESARLGDVERHTAALALEHDQLARSHGGVEGDLASTR